MRIRLLESTCGGDPRDQYATTYLVNDTIAIDCGPLGFWRTAEDQQRIRHVLMTHPHADHIATLPIFVENAYRPDRECVTVWGNTAVLDCIRHDLFNGRLCPNLLELPTREAPFLRLALLEAETPVEIEGVRITPVLVNHTVRTFGLVLQTAQSSIVIVSDTGPTERIWQVANDLPNLKTVFLEASFPNEMSELATSSRHLTPATFAVEVGKLRLPATVVAVHLKARYRTRIAAELATLGLTNIEIGDPTREYVW